MSDITRGPHSGGRHVYSSASDSTDLAEALTNLGQFSSRSARRAQERKRQRKVRGAYAGFSLVAIVGLMATGVTVTAHANNEAKTKELTGISRAAYIAQIADDLKTTAEVQTAEDVSTPKLSKSEAAKYSDSLDVVTVETTPAPEKKVEEDKSKDAKSTLEETKASKDAGACNVIADAAKNDAASDSTNSTASKDAQDSTSDSATASKSVDEGSDTFKTLSDVKKYAYVQVIKRGWSTADFIALDHLWTKESHWNYKAQNPSSGAYGIPQALPGSKMGASGGDWKSNPETQIDWGLNYIAGRYGTPSAAWAHSVTKNWY